MTEPARSADIGQHARLEPVMEAAAVAGNIAVTVGGIAAALTSYAAITGDSWAIRAAAVLGAIAAGLSKVLPRVTAVGARAQVTPVADPRDATGRPLSLDLGPM